MGGTVVDIRLLLVAALKAGTSGIVLAHNHPSGDLRPSRPDEELTHKINKAGTYHDIKVVDHLIVTADGYYSFVDEGLL